MTKTCLRCGKNFVRLDKHLQNKIVCPANYLDIDREDILSNYDKFLIGFMDIKKSKKYKKTCTFCGKMILSKNLSRHIKNFHSNNDSTNNDSTNNNSTKDNLTDIKSKQCKCGKREATYNEPGESEPICCYQCKTDNMFIVKGKRCYCGKGIPYFNKPRNSVPICCSQCKTDKMVNVTIKLCLCEKGKPLFNKLGESTPICCHLCKTDNMVNVTYKRCLCDKAAPSFNKPGESIPICCLQCKTDIMINVKDKRCKGQDGLCEVSGNKKYKGYCTFCFSHEFPNDPITLQIKCNSKEITVRNYINDNFDSFIHDKPLYTGHCDCTMRRRIDHRKIIGNTILAIETDENQHKSYDEMDEEARYNDLYMVHSGKWIYIRFNPDKYISKSGNNKNPPIATRLEKLGEEIKKQIHRIENRQNTELVECIYMYYDGHD